MDEGMRTKEVKVRSRRCGMVRGQRAEAFSSAKKSRLDCVVKTAIREDPTGGELPETAARAALPLVFALRICHRLHLRRRSSSPGGHVEDTRPDSTPAQSTQSTPQLSREEESCESSMHVRSGLWTAVPTIEFELYRALGC
eukprot:6177360-Pleurochrysis_carterae.AAC.2